MKPTGAAAWRDDTLTFTPYYGMRCMGSLTMLRESKGTILGNSRGRTGPRPL